MNPATETKQKNPLFPFMAVGSIIYAFFYTFCLYHNAAGITYPFFVGGTCLLFFCYLKRSGIAVKRFSIFVSISLILLGISTCCTNSWTLLLFNKILIVILFFYLMLHNIYEDKRWDLSKYFLSIMNVGIFSLSYLYRPFSDLSAWKKEKETTLSSIVSEKKASLGKIKYVLLGLVIAMPLLAVILPLLGNADAVFSSLLERIFLFDSLIDLINRFFSHIWGIGCLFLFAFFAAYCIMCRLSDRNIKETVSDKRSFEPLVGITITGVISLVYLVFCLIQVIYLFGGFGTLPENYTYASYAREGFFQLVFVCLINLSLVLICVKYFKKSRLLQGILIFISLCTFVMIASSAYRMLLYIAVYHLTFLRVFVLWALAVIFLLMCGAVLLIFRQDFPLVKYCVIVVTSLYIGFSFSHPDYWIAKYNIEQVFTEETDSSGNICYSMNESGDPGYFRRLSLDAAPAVYEKLTQIRRACNDDEWFQENVIWWTSDYITSKPHSLRKLNVSKLTAYLTYMRYLKEFEG